MKAKIILFMFAINILWGQESKVLIKEGIALHDKRDYEGAIVKYKQALQLEPKNVMALYELSMSYMTIGKNTLCIENAQKGLAIESKFRRGFFTALGNCYSQDGKIKEALQVFEEGLKTNPNDTQLHTNIAVTYAGLKKNREAITHLKEAVKYAYGYTTPYFYIAELYKKEHYYIPALLFNMQYILKAPNSPRARYTAQNIFMIMNHNVNKNGKGDTEVTLNMDTPKYDGDFTSLALMLSLSSASTNISEQNKSEIERQIAGLTGFIQILSEIKDEALKKSFIWEHAAKNLIALQDSDDLITFAYYIAYQAGIKGAATWLQVNKPKVESLNQAFRNLSKG